MSNTCLVMGGVHAPASALPAAKCVAGGGGWEQWRDDRGRPYYHHAARQVTLPLDVLTIATMRLDETDTSVTVTTDSGDVNAARQVTQWAMPPEFLAQQQSASLKDKENRGAGAGGLHEEVGGKRLRASGDVCGSGEGSAAGAIETRTLQHAQKRRCGSGEAGASVIEADACRCSDAVACPPAVSASAAEAVTADRGDDSAPAGRDARLECKSATVPAGEATRVSSPAPASAPASAAPAAASASSSPPPCRRDKASALAQTRGVDAQAHSVGGSIGGSGESVGGAKDGRAGQGVTTLKPPEPEPVANMVAVGLAGALVEKELPHTRSQVAPSSIRDAGAGGAGAGEAVAGGLDVPAVRAVTASSHASGLALGDRILQQCADKRHRWQLAQSGQQAAATADLRLHQMRHFERPFSQSDALSELDVVTL